MGSSKASSVKQQSMDTDEEFYCTVHSYALKPPWHIPLLGVFFD